MYIKRLQQGDAGSNLDTLMSPLMHPQNNPLYIYIYRFTLAQLKILALLPHLIFLKKKSYSLTCKIKLRNASLLPYVIMQADRLLDGRSSQKQTRSPPKVMLLSRTISQTCPKGTIRLGSKPNIMTKVGQSLVGSLPLKLTRSHTKVMDIFVEL